MFLFSFIVVENLGRERTRNHTDHGSDSCFELFDTLRRRVGLQLEEDLRASSVRFEGEERMDVRTNVMNTHDEAVVLKPLSANGEAVKSRITHEGFYVSCIR